MRQDDLKEKNEQTYSSNHPTQNSLPGKEINKFCPPPAATTFAFTSVFILLLFRTPTELLSVGHRNPDTYKSLLIKELWQTVNF